MLWGLVVLKCWECYHFLYWRASLLKQLTVCTGKQPRKPLCSKCILQVRVCCLMQQLVVNVPDFHRNGINEIALWPCGSLLRLWIPNHGTPRAIAEQLQELQNMEKTPSFCLEELGVSTWHGWRSSHWKVGEQHITKLRRCWSVSIASNLSFMLWIYIYILRQLYT